MTIVFNPTDKLISVFVNGSWISVPPKMKADFPSVELWRAKSKGLTEVKEEKVEPAKKKSMTLSKSKAWGKK